MDKGKAPPLVIRVSMDITDKQYVHPYIISFLLTSRTVGRPYSTKVSFVLSDYSYMSLSSSSSVSTWHLYMAFFTV
jgi:hypothetical protein